MGRRRFHHLGMGGGGGVLKRGCNAVPPRLYLRRRLYTCFACAAAWFACAAAWFARAALRHQASANKPCDAMNDPPKRQLTLKCLFT